ncbi:hypothetical protein BZG17_29395 [Escherichia coli]|nr:hypothetical protein [Escherichia coli]
MLGERAEILGPIWPVPDALGGNLDGAAHCNAAAIADGAALAEELIRLPEGCLAGEGGTLDGRGRHFRGGLLA